MNTKEYYSRYRNLFEEKVTADVVAGATPMPEWVILQRVEAPKPTDLPPKKKPGLSVPDAVKNKRDPLVFEVISVGERCGQVMPGQLVSITYLAGDQFAASSILVCNIADITFIFGKGLELPSG